MGTIKQHQNCIEILEKIQSEKMTKRHLTESYFNVKKHFPHLADKYIKQISEITNNINKLQKDYKLCLKLLTNK